jgi:murein DD-endopeptidase MepM/ murein hydrolase activator NlpD
MKNRKILFVSTIAALLIVTIIIVAKTCSHKESPSLFSAGASEVYEPAMAFGINVDTLKVLSDKVRRNQFLSDILLKYDVSYSTIDLLAREWKDVFDVRKIRSGYPYSIITTDDSLKEPLYFIYEESATSFVVFSLKDSIYAYRGEKPVVVEMRSVSGVINSSLWETMVESNTDPNLANELSEIFAWTIDFFGIRKGDYYKVYYEDLMVDGQSIGIGKVRAALINHMGSDQYSFYFEGGEQADYFDEKGGSMRRTFLKAPLRFKRISSKFSYSRYHPILKIRRPHTGVDYAAGEGTPVYTVGEGIVIEKGWDAKGGGNYVKVKHNGTYTTLYMHLKGFASGLHTGQKLKQGDLIGYVGKTGLATGPHLDFRFYRNGKPVDPLKVESPPAEPVDTAYIQQFYHLRDSLKTILDAIPIESI